VDSRPLTNLRVALLAARELGPTALFHYTVYRLAMASGWIRRRTPATEWSGVPLERWLRAEVPSDPERYADYRARRDGPRFFFDGDKPGLPWQAGGPMPPNLRSEAEDLLAGRFRAFGGPPVSLRVPPDWFGLPPHLPRTPASDSSSQWIEVRFDSPGADMRLLWEASRFGWVFPLARSYRWTGEAKYAETTWDLIASWREANPPNHGAHWASGQEAALRILALTFAGQAFAPAWRARPDRAADLAQMVAVHADRITATLAYARAQANNHLLSEGAGLLTAGLMYPEFGESSRWRRLGRAALEDGYAGQVFADGGYTQHSANYHRMALSLGIWAARLAELNGDPLSKSTVAALGRLTQALAAQADDSTGMTAFFGPDDSSNILPLASVEPRDTRAVVAAGARLFLGQSWYPAGPWDETSKWLGLDQGTRGEPPRPASLPQAGLHFLRGRQTRATLRCVRFRGRPGHSDQLHVDLWWGAEPVAIDPGSYLYNAPPPWSNALAAAAVHNAPILDGQEPMRRGGPFLWVDRAQGKVTGRLNQDGIEAIRAEHDGYRRFGASIARSLALVDGRAWLVVDEAKGASERRMTVGWNLPDVGWSWSADGMRLALAQGELLIEWKGARAMGGLVRAGDWVAGEGTEDAVETWGWRSPRYSVAEPCLRLVIGLGGDLPLRLAVRMVLGGDWPPAMDSLWADPSSLDRKFATAAEGR